MNACARRIYPGLLLAVAAAACVAVPATAADTAPAGVAWSCVQETDAYFHVRCMPQRTAAPGDATPAPLPVEPAPAGRGHDLRPVSARGEAEIYSTRAWRIPLYSPPARPAQVAALLSAVLCGEARDCSVAYDPAAAAR